MDSLTLPTDDEIRAKSVWANFGEGADHVAITKDGLLKVCCGYWNGYTLAQILKGLGLIRVHRGTIKPTALGMYACYRWFNREGF